ncbi:hypothetical protein [Pseudomonas sp. TH43]|uniref:hypothetical protein n=1 Tax=Pseudomonas sp. TH43 TaxID=2796407 RepID=UPI001F5B1979|nr:hypothetical protein [Pseudomonas sp. TH43]
MNRPQRFRGLATDPGVQRKTSKAVIQRENKPKGPRLEEQFESICTAPVAPKDQRKVSLMRLVGRAHWENNRSSTEHQMSEQTLQSLLAERVTAFANSDKPVEIIDEQVKKMFISVIDNCFGRYGDMGKQVEEAIKSALPANLTEIFELTRYNAMIAAALKEKWENSGVEADMVRLAQKQIDEVLNKDALPEVISLQDLLEAFVEDHKESAAEEHWEAPDIRFQPSDYGGLHIYFDKKPKDHGISTYSRSTERSEYMLDNAIHISFDRYGKDRNEKGHEVGSVYAAKIDNEKISQTLKFRSPFEKMVAALYFGKSKIIVDCDEDEFSYGIYD